MLYLNGKRITYDLEQVEVKGQSKKHYKDPIAYKIKIEMEEAFGSKTITKPLVVKYPKELITKAKNALGYEKQQFPSSKVIPLVANIANENGEMEEWVWSATPLKVKDGVVEVKQRSRDWDPSSSIIITQKDFELAYFLRFKSQFCKGGEANEGGRYFFEFENKAKDAKNKVTSKQLSIKVQNAIYVELSEDKLRTLARAYHVMNEADLTIDEIREALNIRVMVNEEAQSNFIKNSSIGKDIKFKAMVQQAIDLKIINKYSSGKKTYWAFTDTKNKLKEGATICNIQTSRITKAIEVLVDFLRDNDDLYKEIEKRVKK